jgi:hypothetical protein
MDQNFITLLEAAEGLAKGNESEVEIYLALLTTEADDGRLPCVKSWTEGRDKFPGGFSHMRQPREWRVLRTVMKSWMELRAIGRAWGYREPNENNLTPDPAPALELATTPKSGPLPITTGDMAFCFAGLRWKTEAEWKRSLGNKPKWLLACVAIPGVRGVRETQWNPVCIGAALVNNGHVKANSVRARFQREPLLSAWFDEWKTYEADYLDKE